MVIHYYSTHEMYIVSMSFVYLAGLVTGLRRMVTASTWGEGRTEPGVLGVDPPLRSFTLPDFWSPDFADLSDVPEMMRGCLSLQVSSENEAALEDRLHHRNISFTQLQSRKRH